MKNGLFVPVLSSFLLSLFLSPFHPFTLSPSVAAAQSGLDPSALLKPAIDSWPTYNGDYSGRRYSTLDQVSTRNVKALSLAWLYPTGGTIGIKATPLLIHGVLYLSTQDNAYAIDARTGRELWHYSWKSQGGNHLANRGMAALGDTLYFETPDCHLVALNMRDGSHKWDQSICDLDLFYYASAAPVVIKNHVMVGVSGDDMDNPGYVEAHDPVSGARQWRWWVVPQKMDEPGSETWPNEEAMKHGGGMTWQPVTYDPELNLVYVTTGNPQPVIAFKNRPGDNLFTGSIVALNPDTGKMVWYFQSSPHDTHDWDSTETPVLVDGRINGQPRKLLIQAARNGHFFVLDRTNGKAIVSSEFVETNWSLGHDAKGQPIPNPAKFPQIDGVLVSPNQGGAANWQSPTFQPADRPLLRQCDTGLQRLLPVRCERQPARLGRHRSRRLRGVDAAGDRLSDWKNSLEPSLGNAQPVGPPQHGRQSDLLGRIGRPRSLERDDGRAALAFPDRRRRQRPHHVPARRPAVRRGRRRAVALRVCDESVTKQRALQKPERVAVRNRAYVVFTESPLA